MDFWEGELIGPYWVQRDYRDHKHGAFHLFIGILAGLFALAYSFFPRIRTAAPLPTFLYLVIALLLLFALPFAASQYERRALPLKLLILAGYLAQYICAWIFPVKLFNDINAGSSTDLISTLGQIGNRLMNQLADFFSYLGGLAATLTGVVLGAVATALAFILFLLVLVYVPLLYLYFVKRIQRLYDFFLLKRFFPDRIRF